MPRPDMPTDLLLTWLCALLRVVLRLCKKAQAGAAMPDLPARITALRQDGCVEWLQTGKVFGRETEHCDNHVSRLV